MAVLQAWGLLLRKLGKTSVTHSVKPQQGGQQIVVIMAVIVHQSDQELQERLQERSLVVVGGDGRVRDGEGGRGCRGVHDQGIHLERLPVVGQ